jgi:hypothetical protein
VSVAVVFVDVVLVDVVFLLLLCFFVDVVFFC